MSDVPNPHDELLLFSLDGELGPGSEIATRLGGALAAHEERAFDGGEHKTRSLVNVRGRDCWVLASLDGTADRSANDKLCRLLFFVGALREASARTVSVVVPYLCYSRKERQTKARDPVTTRSIAQMFEALGTDRVVTLDVHDLAAFQNAFRCRTDHLEATSLFVEHVVQLAGGRPVTVVAPDIGGVKRAARFQEQLATALGCPVELAFTEKYRSRGRLTGRDAVLGEVEGRVTVVYDDMIGSGGTMRRVASTLAGRGADEIHLAATHGLFTLEAAALFGDAAVTSVIVTDSVAPGRLERSVVGDRLTVLGLAPLLADAISAMHGGGSVSELLDLPT
ncbi:ribose-phosphate diphosphokinase [Nodularia spumigena]|uniref:ribose-phosphate diphosphokinase n=1 Tax=Nodularia spumigena TaxID=70799 RepID=UPI002B21911A|nr:ribose-phosphate diphosphokinase [Nodularia spumigena]MEA5558043.1 ribose-phosphate diphosphokinase [Nodularia spumigena CH309]